MPLIYHATDIVDASLLVDALARNGIPARIQGAPLAGAAGELPPSDLISVWVDDPAVAERARTLVRDFEFDRRQNAPDRFCPHCRERNPHNFEICWHCRRALDNR